MILQHFIIIICIVIKYINKIVYNHPGKVKYILPDTNSALPRNNSAIPPAPAILAGNGGTCVTVPGHSSFFRSLALFPFIATEENTTTTTKYDTSSAELSSRKDPHSADIRCIALRRRRSPRGHRRQINVVPRCTERASRRKTQPTTTTTTTTIVARTFFSLNLLPISLLIDGTKGTRPGGLERHALNGLPPPSPSRCTT